MQKTSKKNSFRLNSSFNTIQYEHDDDNPIQMASNADEPHRINDDGIASCSNASGTSKHLLNFDHWSLLFHLLLSLFLSHAFIRSLYSCKSTGSED